MTWRVAVTGSTGYVGSRICRRLVEDGAEVIALSRSGEVPSGLQATGEVFELGIAPTPHLLDGVDALVHAAHDFSVRSWREMLECNVEGARRLFDAAQAAGVSRTVFISSVAAFDGCRSGYGRSKLVIERDALARGASVVRPGLVVGAEPGAMFAALTRAADRLPVLPLLLSDEQPMYVVGDVDLAEAVAAMSRVEAPIGLLVAASQEPVTFRLLIEEVARRSGRRVRFVPCSWRLLYGALRSAELVGMHPPFRSDSLTSLVHLDRDPFSHATIAAREFGVTFSSPLTGLLD